MELKAVKNGCDYEIKALHGDTWFVVEIGRAHV